MDLCCDPEVRHGGRCRRTMFTKRCLAGWTVWIQSWPRRRSGSSELEERPGHAPDPRFLCPTSVCGRTRNDDQRARGSALLIAAMNNRPRRRRCALPNCRLRTSAGGAGLRPRGRCSDRRRSGRTAGPPGRSSRYANAKSTERTSQATKEGPILRTRWPWHHQRFVCLQATWTRSSKGPAECLSWSASISTVRAPGVPGSSPRNQTAIG
jgi:hypothetical protein